jgi:hypothetical protein
LYTTKPHIIVSTLIQPDSAYATAHFLFIHSGRSVVPSMVGLLNDVQDSQHVTQVVVDDLVDHWSCLLPKFHHLSVPT